MPTPIRYKEGTIAGWHVNFRHDSKAVRKRFQDKMYGGKWNAHKQALRYIDAVKTDKSILQSSVNLTQSIAEFLSYRSKVKNLSDKTIRSDRQRLSIYQKFMDLKNYLTVDSINNDSTRQFMKYYFDNAPFTTSLNNRREKPRPEATWEKYRQVLSVYFNWCIDEKILQSNPISNNNEYKVPFQKQHRQIFDDMKAILKYFDDNHNQITSCFYYFLAYTGCRLSEATNLKWSEVNFTRNEISFIDTKNKEVRVLPVARQLLTKLTELRTENEKSFSDLNQIYVFNEGDEKYRSDSWYLKRLKEAMTAMAIKKGDLHSFRHTFITNLIENGADLATVKNIAGHKRIETTMKYCHTTAKSKIKSIDRLSY